MRSRVGALISNSGGRKGGRETERGEGQKKKQIRRRQKGVRRSGERLSEWHYSSYLKHYCCICTACWAAIAGR